MLMRTLSCSLRLFLLILVGSTFLFSQNRQSVRDAGAVAAVQTALGNMGYQNLNGVLVPMQIVAYADTQQTGTLNIGSVSFNVNIPNSDFDLAGGGQ